MDLQEGIYGNFGHPPEIRADPFQSYKNGEQVVVGFMTAIAPARGKRPREISPKKKKINFPNKYSLLNQIAEGEEPAIIISTDREFLRDPFDQSIEAKSEILEAEAFTILNKYPIFSRDTEDVPFGVMFVTFPKIALSYPKENPKAIFSMLLSLQNALKGVLGINRLNFNVINFFNIGPNSGASLSQLHSQTYVWKHRFSVLGKEMNAFLEGYHHNGCIACKLINGDQVKDVFGNIIPFEKLKIYEDKHVVVIFAFAPIRLFQTRVILKDHSPNLMNLSKEEIWSLSKSIAIADEAIFEVSSYINYQFEDRSVAFRESYTTDFHMIIDVLPAWPLAGAELVSSITYVSRSPEKATEIFLKRKPKEV